MIGGPELDLGRPDFEKVRLRQRDGLWLVMEANPRAVFEINGSVPAPRTPLHHGDLISIGGVELAFGYFSEAHEPNLETAIARDPGADEPWLVYADWLQERGDPLGERIAQPLPATDAFWLEGLDPVEVTWRRGVLRRAVFREGTGAFLGITRRQITRLLSLRASAFLEELVLDLLADERAIDRPTIQQRATTFVEQLPAMPALRRLSLGYHLANEASPPPLLLDDARFPRLGREPVFLWGQQGLFEVVDAVDFDGAAIGQRLPLAGLRIGEKGNRLFVARIGEARRAACSFDQVGGRVMVQIPEGFANRVWINGHRWGLSVFLLPGDLVEVFGQSSETSCVRLRFNPV